jgi:hypothetical protein
MRYLLAIAVLLAGTGFPIPLHAQHMGAGRSFAPGPARVGFAFPVARPTPGLARVPRARPAPAAPGPRHIRWASGWQIPFPDSGYNPATPCLTNPSYAGSFFCRQHLPRRGFTYVPFYGLPYWYGLAGYPSQEQAPAAPAPVQDTELAGQVERLAEEVELLREDRLSATAPPPAASAPVPEEKPVPAVLVYRDGHKGEAENYAVLGQTLYVFEGERTRKIPLTALDLEATQKLNEEQGVEFVPPAAP